MPVRLPRLITLAPALLLGCLLTDVLRAEVLLVGTQGGPWGKGRLYLHATDSSWQDLTGTVDIGQAVMDIEEFSGAIYVGTQTRSGYGGWGGQGKVWRYDGAWTDVGTLDNSVMVLFVLGERLHAATNRQCIYRLDSSAQWTLVSRSFGTGFRAGVVARMRGRDEAFLGELDRDTFYRYGDPGGLAFMDNYWRSCVYAMTTHHGSLFASCWHGSWYRSQDGEHFQQMGILGPEHLWGLASFQGNLYIGSGRGWTNPGRLREWDGAGLRIVNEFPVTNYAEGVTALATSSDGSLLYIGLGVNDGFYAGDGRAEVWTFDGSIVQRISGADQFGGGVQSLHVMSNSRIELSVECLAPTVLEPGGATLVAVKADGLLPSTSEDALQFTLPVGWVAEPLRGPRGGDAIFAAAIVAPLDAEPGFYDLTASMAGGGGDSSASDPLPIRLHVVSKLTGPGRAAYVHTQAAIRQIRAWDRNLEDPIVRADIPPALDLSLQGYEPTHETRRTLGRSMSVTHYFYQYDDTWRSDGYYSYSSNYAHLYDYQYRYQQSYGGRTYSFSGRTESRALFAFASTVPENALLVEGLEVEWQTGSWANPRGPFPVLVSSVPELRISLAQVFEAILSSASAALSLSTNQLVEFGVAQLFSGEGTLRLGFAFDPLSTPYYTYKLNSPWSNYGYEYRYAYLYLTYGTSPELVLDYLRGTTPEEALDLALELHCEGEYTEANELATYLNEEYGKTIGFWGLAPSRASSNGRRG